MPKRKEESRARPGGGPAPHAVRSISIRANPAGQQSDLKTVSSEEIIEELRSTGRGWKEEMRGMLSLPPRLFLRKTENGSLYSRDLRFGIFEIMSRINSDSLGARESDYGIALYSSGGGVFFVLADMGRKIVVRERIFSIHDTPPERDWNAVIEKIREAVSAAEGEKENAVVSDGILRKVRLQKS